MKSDDSGVKSNHSAVKCDRLGVKYGGAAFRFSGSVKYRRRHQRNADEHRCGGFSRIGLRVKLAFFPIRADPRHPRSKLLWGSVVALLLLRSPSGINYGLALVPF
ncbi:MAG TPA: hypothetical protein VGZ47_05755, partial [Gemmataceae bacterium]|nr:hypothetical protein [Gemmataceae bacterium]